MSAPRWIVYWRREPGAAPERWARCRRATRARSLAAWLMRTYPGAQAWTYDARSHAAPPDAEPPPDRWHDARSLRRVLDEIETCECGAEIEQDSWLVVCADCAAANHRVKLPTLARRGGR